MRALAGNQVVPASASTSLGELAENSQSSVSWYFFSISPTGRFQDPDPTLSYGPTYISRQCRTMDASNDALGENIFSIICIFSTGGFG